MILIVPCVDFATASDHGLTILVNIDVVRGKYRLNSNSLVVRAGPTCFFTWPEVAVFGQSTPWKNPRISLPSKFPDLSQSMVSKFPTRGPAASLRSIRLFLLASRIFASGGSSGSAACDIVAALKITNNPNPNNETIFDKYRITLSHIGNKNAGRPIKAKGDNRFVGWQ